MDVIIATFLLHEFHFKFLVQQLHSQEVNYPDVYHFRHDDLVMMETTSFHGRLQ